jgi:hypothetical protein
MPALSVSADEIASVTRDEIVAYTVFHRLYATLAPEQTVRALLAADMPALVKAIAEVHAHAYNTGYRAGSDDAHANIGIDTDEVNKAAVRTIEQRDEVLRARGTL